VRTSTQPLGLRNTFVLLTRDKRLKIVAVGNSITNGSAELIAPEQNPSFYVALGDWFRKNFPDAAIEVIPKIIFAIGPEVQLFRMDERVTVEKPDLVLVEFNAANGAWGPKGRHLTEPATEGYICRLRQVLPEADCLMEMAIVEMMLDDYRAGAGAMPLSPTFQMALAAHYGCVYADAASEIARRIFAGDAWAAYFLDGAHPSRAGYQVYSDILVGEVERQWRLFQALPESERVVRPHSVPEMTLDPDPWIYPRFVSADQATYDGSFKIETCGKVKFAVSEQPHAIGVYQVEASTRVAGILMRDPGECGKLEVRYGEHWVRLFDNRGPHFTHGDDPGNRYHRDFFGLYGLPSFLDKVEFRIIVDQGVTGYARVEIVGFFVLERSASSAVPPQCYDRNQK